MKQAHPVLYITWIAKESHGADYSGNLVRKKSVTIELYTKIKRHRTRKPD